MPALSILLPTYNGARFLRPQIESICRQSFTDWELLIADDGSSDGTASLATELASTDRRIRHFPTIGNRGQKRRLRELAGEAKSPLIAISDQDDLWDENKLARLLGALGAADMVFGSSWLINARAEPLGRELRDHLPPPFAPGERLTLLFRAAASAHGMVLRAPLLAGAALTRGSSFDWLLSLEAAFGRGLVHEAEAVTFHRLHDSNQANGGFAATPAKKRILSRFELRELGRSLSAMRVEFVRVLEHLSFSDMIAAELQRVFGTAGSLCMRAWFHPGCDMKWRALFERLRELLAPLANVEGDRVYAEDMLLTLCYPALSVERLRARIRRIRREQARST